MERKEGYHLVFEDTFEYEGTPDPSKWAFDIGNHQWANKELQAYTDLLENVYVKNNKLNIIARKRKDGEREYTSARLTTYGKQSWQYGLFEFRVKLPKGKGSWPAVWMLPDSIKKGIPWPDCGEIDIIEHAGQWENKLFFSLHSKRHNHTRKDTKQYTTFYEKEDVCNEFVDYSMEWTPEYVEFWVNGKSACRYNKSDDLEDTTITSWPFDQPFYLILNIAVGGTLGGTVEESSLPYVMEVDYVRIYQK